MLSQEDQRGTSVPLEDEKLVDGLIIGSNSNMPKLNIFMAEIT